MSNRHHNNRSQRHDQQQQSHRQGWSDDSFKERSTWPRQQQLPTSSEARKQEQSNVKQPWRKSASQQQAQQPHQQQVVLSQDREEPQPPQNAWNRKAAWLENPQQQSQAQTSHVVAPSMTEPAEESQRAGTTGAWATKDVAKKGNQNRNVPTTPGSKIVILQPSPHENNKKNANSTMRKEQNINASNPPPRRIRGKKPKLDSISMGDLVPLNKLIPKQKGKGANLQRKPSPVTTIHVTESSDFPALSHGDGHWPSLGDSKPTMNQQPPQPPSSSANKPGATRQQNNSNANANDNINNNHPKKRKNATQQVPGIKSAMLKRKDSNTHGSGSKDTMTPKLDQNHLQAQFFVPPGKLLDKNLIHPSFKSASSGMTEDAQLMLMMKQGQITKGRQRIKPRKKRFTALKRKILMERLKVWKELNPDKAECMGDGSDQTSDRSNAVTVCIYGFVTLEELEDEDEYQEVESNVKEMAGKFGAFENIYIPRESSDEDGAAKTEQPVFVQYATPTEAMAARDCWDGLVIGGQPLKASLLSVAAGIHEAKEMWQQGCIKAVGSRNYEPMAACNAPTCRVLLKGFLTASSVVDDHLATTLENLKVSAEKFGIVKEIQIEQDSDAVILYEGGKDVAITAADGLQSLGMDASILPFTVPTETNGLHSNEVRGLKLMNILTEDDLEDEDCLEESLKDIRALLGKYGVVAKLEPSGTSVNATFSDTTESVLRNTVTELDGTFLGGQKITATVTVKRKVVESCTVVLRNILTEDDIDDEECLEESLADVRELAGRYGTLTEIEANKAGSPGTSTVTISYATAAEAGAAVLGFEGLVIGGQTVEAVMRTEGNASPLSLLPMGNMIADREAPATERSRALIDEQKPMFSGDKLISERFAQCKRVPKIPNKGTPRNYAVLINDDTVKPLLIEMLAELMRLQVRGLNDKNSKARRRVVIGLREVARGLRANKAKMIVMANNLDEYGAVDGKLEEILALAEERGVPVLFELSKRVLGKAVGKKIKVSVVAVQRTDGAHQQFVKLNDLATRVNGTSKKGCL